MKTLEEIQQSIASFEIVNVKKCLGPNAQKLSEEDRQELIVASIINHFTENKLPYFTKVMDIILQQKTNLNTPIDHFAPSVLCLAIELVSLPLFTYFIQKGADVNYVIPTDHFWEDEDEVYVNTHENYPAYITCLDFAEIKMANLINSKPAEKQLFLRLDKLTTPLEDKQISVSSTEYHNLLIQSQQFQHIVNLQLLIDYIEEIGGEMLEEMEK